jgi:hypothetical protein
MVAGHSFRDGRESIYAFTSAGWEYASSIWPGECAAPLTDRQFRAGRSSQCRRVRL